MSRILNFDFETRLDFSFPVTDHVFLLRCLPPELPQQHIISAELIIEPHTTFTVQTDSFGNLIEAGRIDTRHDFLSYRTIGRVELDTCKRCVETPMPIMRFASAYTAMSDEMQLALDGISLPEAPFDRAEALMTLTRERLAYIPGMTDTRTTASDAYHAHHGVCQDFAHVFLAFARHCGMYARYVNGLHEGIGASHAWCEVWIDGIWTGIDPTEGSWVDESYIRFSIGRDFADCPMERGIFNGKASQKQTIQMKCIAEH